MREFIEVGTYTPGSRMVYLTVDSHDTWGYETRCMHVIDTEYAREIVQKLNGQIDKAEKEAEENGI